MHLARFIELWRSKLKAQGIDKAEAARQAVADLTDLEAYALLPIVSRLDHQVSMTTSVHRNLPDHARSALMYWLERTDTQELTRLRDADQTRIREILNRPVVDTPHDQEMIRRYLNGDEWEGFCQVQNHLSHEAWAAYQNFEEIARLRQELARQLGVADA